MIYIVLLTPVIIFSKSVIILMLKFLWEIKHNLNGHKTTNKQIRHIVVFQMLYILLTYKGQQ